MVGRHGQVSGRLKESIDGGGQCSTAAVPQDDDKSQASAEMLNRVPQTAKHVATQTIAGDADHKQVIRAFIEDQLDWHPRVRTAQNRGKWMLTWRALLTQVDAK